MDDDDWGTPIQTAPRVTLTARRNEGVQPEPGTPSIVKENPGSSILEDNLTPFQGIHFKNSRTRVSAVVGTTENWNLDPPKEDSDEVRKLRKRTATNAGEIYRFTEKSYEN